MLITQEDNGENDNDHYDYCYGDDNDEYEEHSGSIDSGEGGRGGTYCTWIILLHVIYTELKFQRFCLYAPPS